MARGKKGADGLTDKQRKFVQARAAGKSQIESYAAAGYSIGKSDNGNRVNACKLEKIQAIQENIEYLHRIARDTSLLDTEARQAALLEIYYDTTNSTKDRLKAIDLLNRMAGDYIDKKEINANINGLSRSDRLDAMQKTLDDLKTAWNASDREE